MAQPGKKHTLDDHLMGADGLHEHDDESDHDHDHDHDDFAAYDPENDALFLADRSRCCRWASTSGLRERR
jgi:hypothetical protein